MASIDHLSHLPSRGETEGLLRARIPQAKMGDEAPSKKPGMVSLWEILTPSERDFVAQLRVMGPLTYRRDGRPGDSIPAPTGRRIDARG